MKMHLLRRNQRKRFRQIKPQLLGKQARCSCTRAIILMHPLGQNLPQQILIRSGNRYSVVIRHGSQCNAKPDIYNDHTQNPTKPLRNPRVSYMQHHVWFGPHRLRRENCGKINQVGQNTNPT